MIKIPRPKKLTCSVMYYDTTSKIYSPAGWLLRHAFGIMPGRYVDKEFDEIERIVNDAEKVLAYNLAICKEDARLTREEYNYTNNYDGMFFNSTLYKIAHLYRTNKDRIIAFEAWCNKNNIELYDPPTHEQLEIDLC